MSIINDALKKAQDKNIQLKKNVKTPKAPSIEIKSDVSKSKINMRWFAILAMVSVPVLAFVAFEPVTEAIKYVRMQLPKIEDHRISEILQKNAETQHVEEEINPQSFALSGIVFGVGTPFAVIDDEILEEGDQIRGGKVVRIEKNKVTLRFDNEEITLILR